MRPFRPFLLACCALPLFASGCAKSPAGGPTVRAANRIQAQLNIVGAVNPLYFYGVAFDDQGTGSQGPVAIIGNTSVTNRVVGGSFRLLVLYNAGTFQVFYRSSPSDESTEQVITGTDNLFVVSPRATTNTISFTLNLDAQLANNTYIFPRGTNSTSIASSRFLINAVTTGSARIISSDPNNLLVRPVDALGTQQVASPVEVQIGGTRSTVIQDGTGAATDENFADTTYTTPSSPDYVDFNRIDIDNLQLAITRSSS